MSADIDAARARHLGQADWLWDDELNCHIPCCTVPIGNRINEGRCHQGPLTGEQIATGDCGGHAARQQEAPTDG